jgi:predicted DNA-binding transcriptional regulator AlpA
MEGQMPTAINADATDAERFLPARRVWERYGVTDMTLWRWIHDGQLNFPKPVYFGRYRYWRLKQPSRF